MSNYAKAYRLGKKDYETRSAMRERPILPALDEILPSRADYTEVSLGLVQIPLDLVVGTATDNRSNAFAGNFMPILSDLSEFALKWESLSISHEKEGIREPIKVYEYMRRFYVLEGNKRVSVLKYYDAVSVPGFVTRILPKKTEDKQNRLYYEFIEFYKKTGLYDVGFSSLGCYDRLCKIVTGDVSAQWTDQQLVDFRSFFGYFREGYLEEGGRSLSITIGDALLAFLGIYDYKDVVEESPSKIRSMIKAGWDEFLLAAQSKKIDLKLTPTEEKKTLLDKILPVGSVGSSGVLKTAFLYEKTPETSGFSYGHELGRMHLEQTMGDEVVTMRYDNVTPDNIKDIIREAVDDGCQVIFTTSPLFADASAKAAVAYPNVHILNCSLHSEHKYMRTYYAKTYEAKFLMGVLAGALSQHDRLLYVANYPVFGTIANINAFALGAKMANPYVRVKLVWEYQKGFDLAECIREYEPDFISDKHLIMPDEGSRAFGLYKMKDGQAENIAMPVYHWGKFYEKLIRAIQEGTWKAEGKGEIKAINYWWGISSEVVDVFYSKQAPIGTRRLLELLKKCICDGEFDPFDGILYSQEGVVQADPNHKIDPMEIVDMSWLAENIDGVIPEESEIKEEAQPIISTQGIETAEDE